MKKHDFKERGKRMDDDRRRVRDALERSTDGATPDLEPLLGAVPQMLAEAARRREQAQRVDLLTASIPFARTAIPRLAAAAAVLVAITTVLLLRGADVSTTTVTTTASVDEWLFSGEGFSEEQLLESLIDPGETR